MNTWNDRLRERLKTLELTQEELADKLGLTRAAITHYLAGRRAPPLKQFKKIAQILKCDPAWLQFGSKNKETKALKASLNKQTIKPIPILNWHNLSNVDVSEFLPTTYIQDKDSNWFALRVHGDTMIVPSGHVISFQTNDIIIVDPDKTPKHGDFVIATFPEADEATFKQFVVDGGKNYLKPLNPQYPIQPIVKTISIIGVVIVRLTSFD